ncbi:MAG: hypothetical protein AAFV19_00725 [Pseudomonadota bacterium]
MRIALAVIFVLALGACRVPYPHEYANFTAFPEPVPPVGTPVAELDAWFHKRGYGPGPRVRQSEAELRRQPGEPLVYSVEADRTWWLTQHRVIRDFCVTQKTIFYRLDAEDRLQKAVQGKFSQCTG